MCRGNLSVYVGSSNQGPPVYRMRQRRRNYILRIQEFYHEYKRQAYQRREDFGRKFVVDTDGLKQQIPYINGLEPIEKGIKRVVDESVIQIKVRLSRKARIGRRRRRCQIRPGYNRSADICRRYLRRRPCIQDRKSWCQGSH